MKNPSLDLQNVKGKSEALNEMLRYTKYNWAEKI